MFRNIKAGFCLIVTLLCIGGGYLWCDDAAMLPKSYPFFETDVESQGTLKDNSKRIHFGQGKTYSDDVMIITEELPAVIQPVAAIRSTYEGHFPIRLRGVTVNGGTLLSKEDLRVLGEEWNVNLIRYMLTRGIRPKDKDRFNPLDFTAYDEWLDGELKKLDTILPICEKYGIWVALDLHSPPGGGLTPSGGEGTNGHLFTDVVCQNKFVEIWENLARRYKDSKVIWGYDIANEPIPPSKKEEEILLEGERVRIAVRDRNNKADSWEKLAERTAKAIRAIDPVRTIIIEPTWGFSPNGLKDFQPIDVPNIVYSVHMYIPGEFTGQGVKEMRTGSSWEKYTYPGRIGNKMWDKDALERVLQPVIDFQKKYGAHIYIGEFSAIRWAPDHSAYRYLKDLIDIFERYGWDWTYHGFREWHGWSVEHDENPINIKRVKSPTDREKLLREWFSKNTKPAWNK